MKIKQILKANRHRPWALPVEDWKYYQEWNNVLFLHWKVEPSLLRKWVPPNLDLDVFEEKAWVSAVAFTMENIRPKYLSAFPPISDFHEINIRTYVCYHGKPGVYFLSIEGGKRMSCLIAKRLSKLPYRFSTIKRKHDRLSSSNNHFKDQLEIEFSVGSTFNIKSDLDMWITERYALFQERKRDINTFDIHHIEWPLSDMEIKNLEIQYPRFSSLLTSTPDMAHYSKGVQVIAWDKRKI